MAPSGDPDVTCLTESMPVYIVDDDESMRKALQRLLRSVGYQALTFTSAEDFLDVVSSCDRGCLILDIRLPGISGLDLQKKLASEGANYSVIFITAHDNPQWLETAKKAGAIAYLRKPFNEQSLLDAMQLACGRKS
jgi:FixJ family two-component response regulator